MGDDCITTRTCTGSSHGKEKKHRILSMKYWLFNRIINHYNYLRTTGYIVCHPPIYLKQPGAPFFTTQVTTAGAFLGWNTAVRVSIAVDITQNLPWKSTTILKMVVPLDDHKPVPKQMVVHYHQPIKNAGFLVDFQGCWPSWWVTKRRVVCYLSFHP